MIERVMGWLRALLRAAREAWRLLSRLAPRRRGAADMDPLRRCPSCGARFHPRFGRVCPACAKPPGEQGD